MTTQRKPRKCQICHHASVDLKLRVVGWPTAALRDAAAVAGPPGPRGMWQCLDSWPCLSRLIDRATDRDGFGQ